MRRAVAAALVVAAVCSAASCGGGGDDSGDAPARPLVGEIAPAVEALEAELGGAQQYFEINATVQFVNLFVARDNATQVQAFLYVDGELAPPAPPEGAAGPTFVAADMTFDAGTVLDGIGTDLPDSDIVVFSVNEGPNGEPAYTATVQSRQGGVLDVTLSPDGETLEVESQTSVPAGATATGPTPTTSGAPSTTG